MSRTVEDVVLALLTGGALFLARPMLHTAEARRSFAPKMFRRWFLAGCTATAAMGIFVGGMALDGLLRGHLMPLSFALSLSLLASAVAVVRMRAWGILLGWATSVALLVAATSVDHATRLALVLTAAVPVLTLLLPVLVARIRVRQADVESVGGATAAFAPARLRVATEPADDAEHEAVGLPSDGVRAGVALRA